MLSRVISVFGPNCAVGGVDFGCVFCLVIVMYKAGMQCSVGR